MTNPLKRHRQHLEKTLGLALDDLERQWEAHTIKSEPQSFELDLRVRLVNGVHLVTSPAGIFGTEPTKH